MDITLLVHNLSRNCLVRTYPIAKALQRKFRIEVVGPVLGNGIFEPYQNELPYQPVYPKKARLPEFFLTVKELLKRIRGKVIYAFKPRLTSLGVALLARLARRHPVILDIEDWDAEPFVRQPWFRKTVEAIRYAHLPNSGFYDWLSERLIPLADERIVVSKFLQNRYGGIRLYHGVDCRFFDPTRYDPLRLKEKWGLQEKRVILFAGHVSAHKGLENLIAAIGSIGDRSLQLLLLGPLNDYSRDLETMAHGSLIRIGPQPHARMPEFLSLAELVVIPQRNTPYAQAQVPGKVFEAMAMAKPIIATAVSDLPEILEGCGYVVPPENPTALAEAIDFILRNPGPAEQVGQGAREKCMRQYSWDAMERILAPVFQRYLK